MRKKEFVRQHISGGKKIWVKPMLTILIRGEDMQERVLLVCKGDGMTWGEWSTACATWGLCHDLGVS